MSTFTSNFLKYSESKRLKIAPSEGPVKGIILALCCHHCCSWPQYVGRPFLQNLGFTAEDFHLLCCLSSWATCGIRAKKRQKGNAGETVDDHTGNSLFVVSQYYLILRWLEWIFFVGYLPSLSINYVAKSKDMEKKVSTSVLYKDENFL